MTPYCFTNSLNGHLIRYINFVTNKPRIIVIAVCKEQWLGNQGKDCIKYFLKIKLTVFFFEFKKRNWTMKNLLPAFTYFLLKSFKVSSTWVCRLGSNLNSFFFYISFFLWNCCPLWELIMKKLSTWLGFYLTIIVF